MKLSEKRQQAVYNAIADPIMDLRIIEKRSCPSELGAEIRDKRLFDMQNEIWRRVHKALNLEGPA